LVRYVKLIHFKVKTTVLY